MIPNKFLFLKSPMIKSLRANNKKLLCDYVLSSYSSDIQSICIVNPNVIPNSITTKQSINISNAVTLYPPKIEV